MTFPTGVGLYLRALSKTKLGPPGVLAKKAADNGVSFVSILACWQDESDGKLRHMASNGDGGLIQEYVDAFANKGVSASIWGFPHAGQVDKYVERMVSVTEKVHGLTGWLHDPEVFFKWASSAQPAVTLRGQPEFSATAKPAGSKPARKAAAEKLMDASHAFLEPRGMDLGVTSYGMANYHPTFPWEEFASQPSWGSPQLYSVNAAQIDQGMDKWQAYGWKHLIPSVPAFGKNSGANMHTHLSHFIDADSPVHGFIVWDWSQVSREEWAILARWADWLKRGVCAVPPIG